MGSVWVGWELYGAEFDCRGFKNFKIVTINQSYFFFFFFRRFINLLLQYLLDIKKTVIKHGMKSIKQNR